MAEVSSKELYKFKNFKRVIREKGRGTELVSVYIPHDKQISDVGKQMRMNSDKVLTSRVSK